MLLDISPKSPPPNDLYVPFTPNAFSISFCFQLA
nr:MAG TPA: hypothetical protein [Bacteriophage sp.]